MEVLIACAVALAGYAMASEGRRARDDLRPPRAPPLRHARAIEGRDKPTREFDAQHAALLRRRWAEAADPASTGVVAAGFADGLPGPTQPFFGSARSQNTNDGVKQARMERFTGALDARTSATGTWRPKREIEPMFSPSLGAQAVTSSGSGRGAAAPRQDGRYEPGTLHNNVTPIEPVRVGRGVGVGPDVPAADGFHPMYRVLPKNVNAYRRNPLPGGVVSGAAPVTKPGAPGRVSVNEVRGRGATVLELERRPAMAQAAAVGAHRVYPVDSSDRVLAPRAGETDRFGNPAAGGPALGARREGCDGGDDPDRNKSLPWINVTGASAGTGAFTHTSFDAHRFCSQQREQRGGHGGFLTAPAAGNAPRAHYLPGTQRETIGPLPVGGVGVVRPGGAVRHRGRARPTLRESINAEEAPLTGTMAAVLGGTLDNVWRYKRLMRDARRGAQLVEHTPNPGRRNVLDPSGMGATALRASRAQATAPGAPTVPNPASAVTVGRLTAPSNKLPSANARLDLGLAAATLRTNPYLPGGGA